MIHKNNYKNLTSIQTAADILIIGLRFIIFFFFLVGGGMETRAGFVHDVMVTLLFVSYKNQNTPQQYNIYISILILK